MRPESREESDTNIRVKHLKPKSSNVSKRARVLKWYILEDPDGSYRTQFFGRSFYKNESTCTRRVTSIVTVSPSIRSRTLARSGRSAPGTLRPCGDVRGPRVVDGGGAAEGTS